MKKITLIILLFLALINYTIRAQSRMPIKDRYYWENINLEQDEPYGLGNDSKKQEGIPEGTITNYHYQSKKYYKGVNYDFWLYVPKQYDSKKPSCLFIFTDGKTYFESDVQANFVFDNLIYNGEMPITIGLFITYGDKGPGNPVVGGTSNRSLEYDSVSSNYPNFLIEEIIPEVKKMYNITDDPRGIAIGGMSSGGICAFNAAWHRPDAFGKIVSHCGSFVNIRGGDKFPEMIRRTPQKPIRVYLQTGAKDANLIWGYWPTRNREMAAALEYAGYDFKFEFADEGGHSLKYGGAVFPKTMRWLWRDYPKIYFYEKPVQ